MTVVQVELPPKLIPVFDGEADYRGAYGGRGSGKTRSFALMSAIKAFMLAQAGRTGLWVCGREYMNSLADSSFAEVKGAIESTPWLLQHYDIGQEYIRTRDKRMEFAFIGLRRNLSSVKSKAKIHGLWVDEAEDVTDQAWDIAIPTVREEGAEIWVTWNPARKTSATHKRFRESMPPRSKIVELNWRDNPRFPAILERKRLEDEIQRPDTYAHIWEGDFRTVITGAYYASALTQARQEGRIGNVGPDPLMTTYAFWDIGGTGAKADACAIWIVQFIGKEIRVLDYYEAIGQPLATHVQWLKAAGYEKSYQVLPHDGANHDKVFSVSYQSALKSAGFEVKVIPNMGAGAAMTRIESVRRVFPNIWFNDKKTEAGRDALGWYHEKRDENRNIGFGPNHDWASHGADAFGLMAVDYLSTNREPANLDGLLAYSVDY